MSIISVKNLIFGYDGSAVEVFRNVSFELDTDWRLGLVGRNGRGKTTLLRILSGELEYRGSIQTAVEMEYYSCVLPRNAGDVTALEFVRSRIAPFTEWERRMEAMTRDGSEAAISEYGRIFEQYTAADGYIIDELIRREAGLLKVAPDALDRPVSTLSGGELTKLCIGAMFLRHGSFRLIDEPTNHLDRHGRNALADYLSGRNGFIVVSHDRAFLDAATDHTMAINRENIEITRGKYSVWKENRDRQDACERSENARLKKDIARLTESAVRAAGYADAVESSKHGGNTSSGTGKMDRGYIGHQSAKAMKRAKNIERRMITAAQEKTELLKNIEQADTLKLHCIPYHANLYAEAEKLSAGYVSGQPLFQNITFQICEGDRIQLAGDNGCGKSTLIRLLLGEALPYTGRFRVPPSLKISYVPQDTGFLHGTIVDFIASRPGIDLSLYMTVLRKLDFTRAQFEVRLEAMSSGQKKKILLAASLCEQAHLYIWDEPLNFIDIFSREQIEGLIQAYAPTMLFVEHDAAFSEKTATKIIQLSEKKERL